MSEGGDALLARHQKTLEEAYFDAARERGESMLFRLRKDAATYLSFRHRNVLYCYTPHADTNGDFWAFDYVEHGTTSVMKRIVRCAKRATAKAKARARYAKAKIK